MSSRGGRARQSKTSGVATAAKKGRHSASNPRHAEIAAAQRAREESVATPAGYGVRENSLTGRYYAVKVASNGARRELSGQPDNGFRTPKEAADFAHTRAAPKAKSAAAVTTTPKPPRQTLTSARAQLRDLTSKVNAADAEVNRAVNAPRDTQDFSRSYRAWQAAIEERDRFFNSLTPEMAAKLRSSEPTPRGSSSGTGTARLNVRASTYNGQSGFTIRGTDTLGRSVSIFSTSRAEAERMRNQIKAGQEPTFDKQRKGA